MVSISIVGVLLGMLIMGVQYAREASRRIQCTNNLRQLVLATMNYESSHRSLPPAGGYGVLNNLGVWAAISTQLEREDVTNIAGIGDRLIRDAPPFPRQLPQPSILNCPSDRARQCNYRVNVGNTAFAYRIPILNAGGGGPFEFNKTLKLSAITDGLSNTMLASERLAGSGKSDQTAILYLGAFSPRPTSDELQQLLESDIRLPGGCFFAGHQWYVAGFLHNWYSHLQTPNPRIDGLLINVAPRNYPWAEGSVSASSNHAGVVMSGLCDGSVRLTADSVERSVWHALGSRDDTEVR